MIYNYIHVNLGDAVYSITIDFTKAFDSINHNYKKLSIKLSSVALSVKTHNWIKEFLNNRFLRVKLNSMMSDTDLSLVLCRKNLNSGLYFSSCMLIIS